MKRVTFLFILLMTALALPSVLAQNEPPRIGAGDTLGITLVGDKEISGQYKVDESGYIKMPLLGSLKVAGETEESLTKKITDLLKKYYVDPVVTVVILERFPRYVTVTGAVRKGGKIPLKENLPTRLIEVIQSAEPEQSADLARVKLTRKQPAPVEMTLDLERFIKFGDPTANVEIMPDDVILVPAKQMMTVYVTGAVARPGAVILQEGSTFREAMLQVGGLQPNADSSRITIRHEASTEEIPVNYTDAMSQDPAKQVVLKSGDRILVPTVQEAVTVSVYGGVNRPGPVPLLGRMRLSEAIGSAGGFNPYARKWDIKILRAVPGSAKRQTIKVNFTDIEEGKADDPYLEPNDQIVVAERSREQFNLGTALSLLSAIASLAWLLRRR
ncbi:MAG: SLBB domain-containing protein [Armatimonadota bacterium]